MPNEQDLTNKAKQMEGQATDQAAQQAENKAQGAEGQLQAKAHEVKQDATGQQSSNR